MAMVRDKNNDSAFRTGYKRSMCVYLPTLGDTLSKIELQTERAQIYAGRTEFVSELTQNIWIQYWSLNNFF